MPTTRPSRRARKIPARHEPKPELTQADAPVEGEGRKKRAPRVRFNGEIRDLPTQAGHLGLTEKALRAQVSRGLIPFHRMGARIIFIPSEITEYLRRLPGVSVDQAVKNLEERSGKE